MNCSAQSGRELELIAAILDGDTQLYHQLIRPYERSVYRMALCCMKNEKEAEGVAQETFIRAFRDLWTFRGDSKFSAWLIGIALNEARSQLRQKATLRIASLDEPQGEEMPVFPALLNDWQELPLDVVEREEIGKLILQTVAKLPGIDQQVFFLRDVEELSANETAQILEINPLLVKVALHRARMMLQRILAPKFKALNSS